MSAFSILTPIYSPCQESVVFCPQSPSANSYYLYYFSLSTKTLNLSTTNNRENRRYFHWKHPQTAYNSHPRCNTEIALLSSPLHFILISFKNFTINLFICSQFACRLGVFRTLRPKFLNQHLFHLLKLLTQATGLFQQSRSQKLLTLILLTKKIQLKLCLIF